MAPVVHGLEEKYGDQVRFVYLDIDDPNTQALQEALEYNRRWRPFIVILDGDGNIILDDAGQKHLWIGVIPGETLELGVLYSLGY
jgi:hypothetical protein